MTLVWFRGKDLRLADHRALRLGGPNAIFLFVLDPYFFAPERARRIPHRMQFLLESIASLREEIARRGSRLLLAAGKSIDVVPALARKWKVDRVVAQRWSEPFGKERDDRIGHALDVPFDLVDGETLAPPGSIRNGEGNPYSVFTPFARALRRDTTIGDPIPAPRTLSAAKIRWRDASLPSLADLGIARNPNLPLGGEREAKKRLARFLDGRAAKYHLLRDRLDRDATSRLSVDLHFGTLSPREVWIAAEKRLARKHPRAWQKFSDELLWREFAHAVLHDHPALLEKPRRPELAIRGGKKGWEAWCAGTTGYPIVDAAARQLLAEGFVHNRARMISASFLAKDLRIDYRRGEAHFLEWLVDGDWANNNFGWQWTAGCGFDAAPYFRVFNPVEQGKRYDPTGGYVRKWVPELAHLPTKFIHEPWRAPDRVEGYPRPIVDHAEARGRYLSILN